MESLVWSMGTSVGEGALSSYPSTGGSSLKVGLFLCRWSSAVARAAGIEPSPREACVRGIWETIGVDGFVLYCGRVFSVRCVAVSVDFCLCLFTSFTLSPPAPNMALGIRFKPVTKPPTKRFFVLVGEPLTTCSP